jgi:hypothetical protein
MRCTLHNRVTIVDRGAHGLFHQYMHIGVERVVKYTTMREIGRGNDDRIDKSRCQEVSVVGKLGWSMR